MHFFADRHISRQLEWQAAALAVAQLCLGGTFWGTSTESRLPALDNLLRLSTLCRTVICCCPNVISLVLLLCFCVAATFVWLSYGSIRVAEQIRTTYDHLSVFPWYCRLHKTFTVSALRQQRGGSQSSRNLHENILWTVVRYDCDTLPKFWPPKSKESGPQRCTFWHHSEAQSTFWRWIFRKTRGGKFRVRN